MRTLSSMTEGQVAIRAPARATRDVAQSSAEALLRFSGTVLGPPVRTCDAGLLLEQAAPAVRGVHPTVPRDLSSCSLAIPGAALEEWQTRSAADASPGGLR
ncbi:MAG TPA: hypothetical protein VMF62_09330 [Acetobacteraceae bacterium]|nr:hypothetical protein [Acetobacteraceae bacterium]